MVGVEQTPVVGVAVPLGLVWWSWSCGEQHASKYPSVQ